MSWIRSIPTGDRLADRGCQLARTGAPSHRLIGTDALSQNQIQRGASLHQSQIAVGLSEQRVEGADTQRNAFGVG